jgi:predicted ArsR family transcriptional regulator
VTSVPTPITDPRALRAIAHPLRVRLLHELHASGVARAADLARTLDVPANQVSFHLRMLARYGLVEEAPEHARDRRDRVWRPVSEGGYTVDPDVLDEAAGGPTAVRIFRQSSQAWTHEAVRAFFAAAEERSSDDTIAMSQAAMRLTPGEAKAAIAELQDVVQRWSQHGRDRMSDGDTEDRATYLGLLMLQPYPERLRETGD